MAYDIIGDIHGEAPTLRRLLEKLGYKLVEGTWRHPERTAIFLGDFIDRGEYERETLAIVMPMVRSGGALAVMGNHEFNALAFHTKKPGSEGWLRNRTNKNIGQHMAFLADYLDKPDELADALAFFRELPLWLDLDGIRVVHACWERELISKIDKTYEGSRLTNELLIKASTKGCWEYSAIETLLKGKEAPLPKDHPGLVDKDGNRRHEIRIKWWDAEAISYRSAYMGPDWWKSEIPDGELDGDYQINYGHHEPPVFLGHYWMKGEPEPLAPSIACVDYSVAKPGGHLVAYRWDGEARLSKDKFVAVERV